MLDEPELLSGTTPGGLPYPSPTDPVAGGAAAIQALATAVEARLGYRLIQELVLGSAGHLTFTAIPATFRALRLIYSAKSDAGSGAIPTYLRLNDDAGSSNYGNANGYGGVAVLGYSPGANMPAEYVASGEVEITWPKAITPPPPAGRHVAIFSTWIGRTAATGAGSDINQGTFNNIWLGNFTGVAVNKIELFPGSGNFMAGGRAALYGLV